MKKGFTLIELLAVIVILAIIALIATPIVLNIIEDSKNSSMLRSSEMYLDAVEYGVAKGVLNNKRVTDGTYNILSNGNICIETYENGICKDKDGNIENNELIVEVKGETPISGTITLENGAIKNHTLSYQSNITIVDGSIGEKEKVCKLTLDEDKDGKADTGDMITCSTESFHVIENDGTTISMLAQYNLNVGYICDNETGECDPIPNPTGLQSENAKGWTEDSDTWYGTEIFSTTNYWYDADEYIVDTNYASEGRSYPFVYGDYKDESGNQQNIIYPYIKAYEEYLIGEGVKSAEGTLISYEQLIDLGCEEYSYCSEENEWVYATSYWSGSARDDFIVWDVDSVGYFGSDVYDDDYGVYGVRPVININVNEL